MIIDEEMINDETNIKLSIETSRLEFNMDII